MFRFAKTLTRAEVAAWLDVNLSEVPALERRFAVEVERTETGEVGWPCSQLTARMYNTLHPPEEDEPSPETDPPQVTGKLSRPEVGTLFKLGSKSGVRKLESKHGVKTETEHGQVFWPAAEVQRVWEARDAAPSSVRVHLTRDERLADKEKARAEKARQAAEEQADREDREYWDKRRDQWEQKKAKEEAAREAKKAREKAEQAELEAWERDHITEDQARALLEASYPELWHLTKIARLRKYAPPSGHGRDRYNRPEVLALRAERLEAAQALVEQKATSPGLGNLSLEQLKALVNLLVAVYRQTRPPSPGP